MGGDNILIRDQENGVVTITLNRPSQYNALSEEMLEALSSEFDQITKDDSARVVVLAANGKAFCAGHDLKQMIANEDKEYFDGLFSKCSEVMLQIRNLEIPVLAKVHGIATAAGCQLVANCDLAVASLHSKFAVSGINVGLFCSTPAIPLSRNVSAKRAFEMLTTGDFIGAEQACDWGLINRAVAEDELDSEVDRIAQSICAKSKEAIRIGKKMFYEQLGMSLSDAYEFGADKMACNMMSEDAREGITAFIEKRAPNWKK